MRAEDAMKLVLFARDGEVGPGVLVGEGVVGVGDLVRSGHTPQETMSTIIDDFDQLRGRFEVRAASGTPFDPEEVRLLPPLPRPGKVLGCIGNYWEHAQREPRPLNMFMKNPDAVIGPEDTVELPEFEEPWMFMHEAELAIVMKGPAKMVSQEDWRTAVFGYTCLIDVSARGEGRSTWKQGSWLGKSFDTFCPIGPCIATADEIPDPNDLHVQFWDNGQLRHNYHTDDMEHRVPELVEFATTIMTMRSGDLISCGTNHEGLGPLQDGERIEIAIGGIGQMSLNVADPLKRSWEVGIYMGADSTNHEAVRRYRPDEVDRLVEDQASLRKRADDGDAPPPSGPAS
jgi:2-keto-4-pentenoate hydratase/2-oxohepta-3-ene-1,7-dioic acid hydratase in catechol pathway